MTQPNAGTGLTKEWSFSVGVDPSQQLHARAKLGAWYTYEQARADQDLRWRPRTFAPSITVVDDPRSDLSTAALRRAPAARSHRPRLVGPQSSVTNRLWVDS